MLYTYVQRFDVTDTAQKFLGIFGQLNQALERDFSKGILLRVLLQYFHSSGSQFNESIVFSRHVESVHVPIWTGQHCVACRLGRASLSRVTLRGFAAAVDQLLYKKSNSATRRLRVFIRRKPSYSSQQRIIYADHTIKFRQHSFPCIWKKRRINKLVPSLFSLN
jgi:hypothetical protein